MENWIRINLSLKTNISVLGVWSYFVDSVLCANIHILTPTDVGSFRGKLCKFCHFLYFRSIGMNALTVGFFFYTLFQLLFFNLHTTLNTTRIAHCGFGFGAIPMVLHQVQLHHTHSRQFLPLSLFNFYF